MGKKISISDSIYSIYFGYYNKYHFHLHRKRQINRPRPVDEIDMEAIFKQAKEEQEKHEKEFEEEQQRAEALKSEESQSDTGDSANSAVDSKPKPQARKSTKKRTKLVPGSMVKVLSGNFAEFKGSLKKINRKTKKVRDAEYWKLGENRG